MRWHAKITFFTPAKGLRYWEGEVEGADAAEADQCAMEAFRLSRLGLKVPELVDVRLRRVKR